MNSKSTDSALCAATSGPVAVKVRNRITVLPSGLQSRFIIAVFLVAGPVLLAAIDQLKSFSNRLLEASAQAQLVTAADAASAGIERRDRFFVKALQNLSTQSDVVSMDPVKQLPILKQMLRTYELLEIARVTCPDGFSVARTDGDTPMDYSDREWFKSCLNGSPVARQVLVTKTSNNAALNISTPIRDQSGSIVGVLSAVIRLGSMADLLDINRANREMQIYVVDERGNAVAGSDLQDTDRLADLRVLVPVQRALTGTTGPCSFIDENGVDWIAQVARLSNGWVAVCQIPRTAVLAHSVRMTRAAYLVGTLALLLLLLFAGTIARQVTKPVNELTCAADDFSRGDFSRRVTISRKDELGDLGTSFNQMAESLEAACHERKLRTEELQRANELLRLSEERYALAVRGANDGIWDWDLKNGRVFYSVRWKEMLGHLEDQIGAVPSEWFDRVHPDDIESVQSMIAAQKDNITPHFQIEYRMRHADGRYRWMLTRGSAVQGESGEVTRLAGSQSDVTPRREAEEQLRQNMLHDSLTGLPNRVLFADRLERSLIRTSRDKQHRFAVMFLDIDRFKAINDSLGHVVGDQLLNSFAARIANALRPTDTFARLGGDEFAILLEDPRESDDTTSIANRILALLKESFLLGSHEVYVTVSIGIAHGSRRYTRPQDVLRDADLAMYRAKANGKARYEVFDVAMHVRAVKMLRMENDLRRAVDRGEFEVFYQPIIRMKDKYLRAFEALVRWRHPTDGLVGPDQFIPIAEETGLIVPIGKWVLEQACRQTVQWHTLAPDHLIEINVNLSARQFAQPDLVEQVTAILAETGLEPRFLNLEITESCAMENPEATIGTLRRLKQLGVKLNIDDFGTGYSSLAYLQRFPVDTMKVDRSFVANMIERPENAEIINTIVQLAHSLHIKVTAEGIENDEQLAQLDALECENAQGYLFSRPLDPQSASHLLFDWCPQSEASVS